MKVKFEVGDALSLICRATNSLSSDIGNLTNDGKIKTNDLRDIGRIVHRQSKGYDKERLKSLIEGVLELDNQYKRTIAFDILYRSRRKFLSIDDKDFMYGIIYHHIDNWVYCDDFCTHSFYCWVASNNEEIPSVIDLTESSNPSVRRAAVVTFIKFAGNGEYLRESLDVIERLLDDPDYLVQKAIGWLIKVHFKYNSDNKELISWCLMHEPDISVRAKSYFKFDKYINNS